MAINGEHQPRRDGHIAYDVTALQELITYPTRSLEFLKKREQATESPHKEEQSAVCLDIIITGAGLGGLAVAVALTRKGHRVRVFEQAQVLSEVGAGIQTPPNSTRLLISWGLEPYLRDLVVEPHDIKFRRWQNGKVIGLTKLMPEFRQRFDAPYWVIHRAHFHDALYRLAIDTGVAVKVGSRVEQYIADEATIVLANGDRHSADLIVACDGIKSTARKLILGGVDKPPVRVPFSAYRATVDVKAMKADPDTAALIEKPCLNLWVGDRRHVMAYPICAGNTYNVVLQHPDDTDPATWDQKTALTDMRRVFGGWDPTLTKVINMVQTTQKWPMISGDRMERWIHPSHKLIMMGDAAHGAAIAVEDAAALAAVMDMVTSMSQIPQALKVWESVRMERSGQMQDASLLNSELWHFPDGPVQQARDEAMSKEVDGRPFESSPNQWTDPVTQRWTYGYDAVQIVQSVGKAVGLGQRGSDIETSP